MIRIASINLRKGIRNAIRRERFSRWLATTGVDVVLTQEPSVLEAHRWPALPGYTLIHGSSRVGAWVRSGLRPPPLSTSTDFAQRLDFGYASVYNVYLDAYLQTARAGQLHNLAKLLTEEDQRPLILLGDFNLAPSPRDGMAGKRESTFNSDIDRLPLAALMQRQQLVDALRSAAEPEFTIERELRGTLVRFRCDLALVSDSWAANIRCRYDHSVRSGEHSFTDHSAIIVDVPVTVENVPQTLGDAQLPLGLDLNGPGAVTTTEYKSHRTAMTRRRESPVARHVVSDLVPQLRSTSILDYGCGHGQDVRFYRRHGLTADGFDPHPPFGWNSQPKKAYDLVTLVFVLNVIADPVSRFRALADAASYLGPQGVLVVAARSPAEIDGRANSGHWPPHNDGYWSDKKRGMFQKGISLAEMDQLAERMDLQRMRDIELPDLGQSTSWALFGHPVR